MQILTFVSFVLYHLAAGWIYYKYISEKEILKHKGQKDIKEVHRFFHHRQSVIILMWPLFMLVGIYQKVRFG